jgi:hypothetical protein
MEFKIKKLPKVKISELDFLPTTSGLFFVIDHALRVWYVGTAKNLRESLKEDQMYSIITGNLVSQVAYFQWEDWDDLTDWEVDCLAKFNPPLNLGLEESQLPVADLGYSQSQYLNRYKDIQDMIKILEQEKEELKPNIISLLEENDDKIHADTLKAWISSRKSYTYSPQLESMRREIAEMQKDEELSGVAQVKSVLVFPVVKGK